jgi:hypothetical protein
MQETMKQLPDRFSKHGVANLKDGQTKAAMPIGIAHKDAAELTPATCPIAYMM